MSFLKNFPTFTQNINFYKDYVNFYSSFAEGNCVRKLLQKIIYTWPVENNSNAFESSFIGKKNNVFWPKLQLSNIFRAFFLKSPERAQSIPRKKPAEIDSEKLTDLSDTHLLKTKT